MSDIAIRVENLGKAYKIAHNAGGSRYKTLQEDVIGLLKRPFSRERQSTSEIFWALKDISFEVKQGEVLGIIGRNGAGKSTLLKILSRITRPTTGYAEMHGRIGSLLEVGTGFHPELTGRENIYLSGAVLGMTRRDIDRRFDEIVAFADIEKFLDTPAKRYSSGMYMRLAFAVAAHLEPEILVVDEVLAVGDAEFQKKSLGKMGEVAKSGRTVLFVSHNMGAVLSLCTSALVLDKGTTAFIGKVDNGISLYLKNMQTMQTRNYHKIVTKDRPIEVTNVALLEEDIPETNIGGYVCEIDYFINQQSIGAAIAIKITDQYGAPVLTSIDTDTDLSRFTKQRGSFRTKCRIPQNILSPGLYDVSVSVSDMKSERFEYLDRVVQFDVQLDKRIKNVLPNREGVILLPQQWDTEVILSSV